MFLRKKKKGYFGKVLIIFHPEPYIVYINTILEYQFSTVIIEYSGVLILAFFFFKPSI